MKRSRLVVIVIAILLCILIAIVFYPQKIIHNPEQAVITQVRQRGEDITDEVDSAALISIIKDYKYRRSWEMSGSYLEADVEYEIGINDGGKPVHILLGKYNVFYVTSSTGGHGILDSERLVADIEKLLED